MVELTWEEEQEIIHRVARRWEDMSPDRARPLSVDHLEEYKREIRRECDALLGEKEGVETAARNLAERPEREERLRVKRLLLRGQRRRFVRS